MTPKPNPRNPVRCATDPQKWDLLDGANGYLTDDNRYAVSICNTVCPLLEACYKRAMEKAPRSAVQAGLIWNYRGRPYTLQAWENSMNKRTRKHTRKPKPMPREDLTPQQKYDDIYRQIRNLISSCDYLDPNARTYSLLSISDNLAKLSSELFPGTEPVGDA